MTTVNEITTGRFDALRSYVGHNHGNYIIHGVFGDISIFSDFTNGKEAVQWLFSEYFKNEHIVRYTDDYDCRHARLVGDMQHLGHDWCGTIQNELLDSMRVSTLGTPSKKSIRKGRAQPNTLKADTRYENKGYAKATMEMFLSSLEDVGFIQLNEIDIYEGIVDARGLVRTPHVRVVITPNVLFVSHPLCSRCGAHSGACLAFYDYENAVDWADNTGIVCPKCQTPEEMERARILQDELGDEWDDPEYGMATECPMR
jgi:hypothetical protein